jgi:alanine dehydrogenase
VSRISIGLAQIHAEAGERRDFLPEFVAHLEQCGAEVVLEHGYGGKMGLSEADYNAAAPRAHFSTLEEVYSQDMVLVLRYPGDDKVRWMRPGTCLVSMLHYPTRPQRVQFLRDQGIRAISLDSIKDNLGRRIVENLRAVGWNGVEAAFQQLAKIYPPPGIEDPNRNPIKVTVMGAGAVGMFAIQAAVRYGNETTWRRMAEKHVTGVQVTAVEFDLTNHPTIMTQILKYTDILVDATQRPDPSQPIIPNTLVGVMRPHAILLDLSVDPYDCTEDGMLVIKGIEGVPQGNLDQYVFGPEDPAYTRIPECVDTRNRRWSISCYSWPGIYPEACMRIYGKQLEPLFQTILEAGGVERIQPENGFFQRALASAMLSRWQN